MKIVGGEPDEGEAVGGRRRNRMRDKQEGGGRYAIYRT